MAKKLETSSIIYQASAILSVSSELYSSVTQVIDLGYSIRDLVVMRIKKIDYSLNRVNGLVAAFGATGDKLEFGLSQDPSTADADVELSAAKLGMVDFNRVVRADRGTSATSEILKDPFISKNKMDIYPDGQLCHPASLYAWYYVANALAQDLTIDIEIYYDIQEIDQGMYQQLINQLLIQR